MQKCRCSTAASRLPDWYPARLIDLNGLKPSSHKGKAAPTNEKESSNRSSKLKVVETVEWEKSGVPGRPNSRYVTLSHCWGPNPKMMHQLDSSTRSKYMGEHGFDIEDLPRTFRDAIQFAARLPRVGYIWIDSLCIVQRDQEDWLKQSATMEKVYSNTFLNISATDSDNMEGGLFRDRDPESLLEDEVILNIAGLPGIDLASLKEQTHPSGLVDSGKRVTQPTLRRCTILDVSFWADRVSRAPVNKRGWVLQERLMAPRVLHFCADQIAWECREFDAAEGQPQDVPLLQLVDRGVVEEIRLRGFDDINTGAHDGYKLGRQLRLTRLAGLNDPDAHLQSTKEIFILELWSRIVEEYSMTAITKAEDKLIALSGIARRMSHDISRSERHTRSPVYVAGLWTLWIESQLLWFVEPDFQESDGTFRDRSKAPKKYVYRAPSFSWAAVDVHKMRGIKYAEVTDKDLLIELVKDSVSVTEQPGSDIFGILKDAHLTIRGKLRKAEIEGPNEKGRYSWKLRDCGELDKEEHRNVYLDCPSRDGQITGPDANIYVVPAARGSRLAPRGSKYMVCLLLQLVLEGKYAEQKAFRRIGLTKLSPWADSKALEEEMDASRKSMAKILVPRTGHMNMPHVDGYDPKEGTHKILLV